MAEEMIFKAPHIVDLLSSNESCTIEANGLRDKPQKAFICEDCGLKKESDMICETCSKVCHKGHKVIFWGNISGFCDCRLRTQCCKF